MRRHLNRYPNTRLGWYNFYVAQYERYENPTSADLACTYYLLHLAFGD